MSVAIDSMVIIWGMRKAHHKGRKPTTQDVVEMRRRSIILLQQLAAEEEEVILPAVAAAEVLLGIEPKHHGLFIAELQSNFKLPPFDLAATSLSASLWQSARSLPKGEQTDRVCLKADVMIVATAKVAGASIFYSHEPQIRRLLPTPR